MRLAVYRLCGLCLHRYKDLITWDEDDISDPRSIKGIAAELAALFGPNLVQDTVLSF